jgi:transcriptional regulator with XRE-family HTH domain
MNHKDFGQLVAALRREHRYLDKDSKVRFWSQERLAEVANLSEDTIIKIEGGRKRNLSPDILLKLAQALNLTTEERVEFFMAANDLDDRQIIRCPDNPHDTLQHLVQTLQQTYLPAFIIDTYCDVLAVNEAVLMIFNVSDNAVAYIKQHPIGTNMLTFVFSPELNQQEVMKPHAWETYAYSNLMFFRTNTLRYRATPYFRALFSELYRWRLFQRYWEEISYQERDYNVNTEHVHINNPVLGPLHFYSTLYKTLTRYGYLSLFVYVPADSTTAKVFYALTEQEGCTNVVRFGLWPKEHWSSSLDRFGSGAV